MSPVMAVETPWGGCDVADCWCDDDMGTFVVGREDDRRTVRWCRGFTGMFVGDGERSADASIGGGIRWMDGDGRRRGGTITSKEMNSSSCSGLAEWETRLVDRVLWNEGARIMNQT